MLEILEMLKEARHAVLWLWLNNVLTLEEYNTIMARVKSAESIQKQKLIEEKERNKK